MNYTDLEKIKLQIKRYGLIDEIPNIVIWLNKLKEKQINNFLLLNIDNLGFLEKYKKLLVNLKFLYDDNYILIINMLSKKNNEIFVKTMTELLLDSNFINSKYYEKDLKFLFEEAKFFDIEDLAVIVRSSNSINGPFHEEDLRLVSKTNNEEKRKILVNLACNNISIKSKHHSEDMQTICKVDDIYKAELISTLSKSRSSSENDNYNEDVKLILASDQAKASYLTDVACNVYSFNSRNHKNDMNLIYESKTNKHAECLSALAKSITSIFSPLHAKHMKILSETKEENLSYMLEMLKKREIAMNSDLTYITFLATCNNIKKVECMSKIILSDNSKYDVEKKNIMLGIMKSIDNNSILETIIELININIDSLYSYIKSIKNIDKLNECLLIRKNILESYNNVINNNEKEKKLTNKEKLDIIMNNAVKYKDSNELPSSVFKVKVNKK